MPRPRVKIFPIPERFSGSWVREVGISMMKGKKHMKTSTTTPPPSRRAPNQPNTTEVPQNMKTRSLTILATIITALVAFTSASDALAQGETWAATGSLNTARDLHTASLLPNGMVLAAGGFNNSVLFLNSAELYDPASGTWTATGSLNTA